MVKERRERKNKNKLMIMAMIEEKKKIQNGGKNVGSITAYS